MKYLYKNPFERISQKGIVAILCIVCMLFVWSCKNKSEADQPLSNEEISANISINGEVASEFLFWLWDIKAFAYTADGIKFKNFVDITSNTSLYITDHQFSYGEENDDKNDFVYDQQFISLHFKSCSYVYSMSGNFINFIQKFSECFLILVQYTDEDIMVINALKSAYSCAVKDNQLIIYFTGKEDKNILILQKR